MYLENGSIYWLPQPQDRASLCFWLPPKEGVDRVAGNRIEFEGKVLLQSGDPSAAVTRYFGPAGKHRAETAKGPGYSPEYWEWWFSNGPSMQLQVVAHQGSVAKIVLARHWQLDKRAR